MTTKGDAELSINPRPVRPLDPVWLDKFLTSKQIDQKKIRSIIRALNKYNLACNKAGEKFTQRLKEI